MKSIRAIVSRAQRLLLAGTLLGVAAAALAAGELRVVTEELPPYNMTQGGQITGMSTEVVQAVMKEAVLLPLPENDMIRFCKEAQVDPALLQKVLTLDEMTTGIYMAYSRGTPDEVVQRTRAAFDKSKAEGTMARLMRGTH